MIVIIGLAAYLLTSMYFIGFFYKSLEKESDAYLWKDELSPDIIFAVPLGLCFPIAIAAYILWKYLFKSVFKAGNNHADNLHKQIQKRVKVKQMRVKELEEIELELDKELQQKEKYI